MPETMRQGAHRALRQVLAAAVRWRWIDHNVATDVPNPMHARAEFDPFESWEEVMALARELGPYGPIDINNFRSREWVPALKAAGIEHRRIYDMRHTYATWSLAAGVSPFTLSRRMGTSLAMIDATYGHLAPDAEEQEQALLDAYDAAATPRGDAARRMTPSVLAGHYLEVFPRGGRPRAR